jgi:hypothetical protein
VVVAAAVLLGLPPSVAAQTPAPRPEDVATIDGIMHAVYDVISGPAGQARDWNRFRSLFAPGARLVPTGRDSAGKPRMRTMTPDEYAQQSGPGLERNGFFEREIGRVMERYGNVVHLFSAYDSKRKADDPQPFARGINSFQLWWDGSRWWVVTIFWQGETPDHPIPAKYLGKP